LLNAVQVKPTTVAWTAAPNLPVPAPPKKKVGRPRRYPPPEAWARPQSLEEVARQLPASAWRRVTWRQGSRGAQRSRCVMLAVWAAHGWQAQPYLARVREWLLVEWPADKTAPTKYWLAQLGAQPWGLRRLVRTAKARWRIEQDYRELKAELGLDHDEGRQWLGWHHPVCLVTIAYAFLRSEQARFKKHFWCDLEPAPGAEATAGAAH
jgi:SRSO17 transposase